MKIVGIWGSGVVGKATGNIFEVFCKDIKVIYYDKFKNKYKSFKKDLLKNSDFIFLCLPTPMKITGEISLQYIEESLQEINNNYNILKENLILIIRSTSVSGSSDFFAKKYPKLNIAFCPEFLTEKNSNLDSLNTNRIIIGADNNNTYEKIKELFKMAYDNRANSQPDYIYLNRSEAETYKYLCNCFLASQVMVANEIYFICKKINIDYDKLRKILFYDKRIGTFTQVPGHDGDYGIGGKCFPKDMNAFIHLAKKNGYNPLILETMMNINDRIRLNKDWLNINGAVENKIFEEDF